MKLSIVILLLLGISHCILLVSGQTEKTSTCAGLSATDCKAAPECQEIMGHLCKTNKVEFLGCGDAGMCGQMLTCAKDGNGEKAGFPTACIPPSWTVVGSPLPPGDSLSTCCPPKEQSHAEGEMIDGIDGELQELYYGEPYEMMYEEQNENEGDASQYDDTIINQYEYDGAVEDTSSSQSQYDPYGAQYDDEEYEDIGVTDEQCTPWDKPAPLANFNAASLDGVWFEIAASILPRSMKDQVVVNGQVKTLQQECYCTFVNMTLITDPMAKQQFEGRAIFDMMATCKKGSVEGTRAIKIGQALQIHPTGDPSSFQYFLLDAKKDAQGRLVPIAPPQQPQQPPQQVPPRQAPLAPPVQRRQPAAPQQPTLADTLVPNLVTLKSIGEGNQQSLIMAGPCMETLWVMSRQSTIDDETYKSLLAAATAAGIDLNKSSLAKTVQEGCPAPSFP